MASTDYSALDRPEISMNSFYPRRNRTALPEGAEDFAVSVAEDITLSCRFFPVSTAAPTVLFFYGNGETAADYDNIAPIYNQVGISFFVADYRGYGQSGGLPTFTAMLSDAHRVREELVRILAAGGYTGDVFVMGRSMGRHPAFELAANAPNGALKGLILESGRPNLGQFCYGLAPEDAAKMEAAYREKVRSIGLPALVIHGEQDTLGAGRASSDYVSGVSVGRKAAADHPGSGAQRPALPGN